MSESEVDEGWPEEREGEAGEGDEELDELDAEATAEGGEEGEPKTEGGDEGGTQGKVAPLAPEAAPKSTGSADSNCISQFEAPRGILRKKKDNIRPKSNDAAAKVNATRDRR